jgi:hypothetical protein
MTGISFWISCGQFHSAIETSVEVRTAQSSILFEHQGFRAAPPRIAHSEKYPGGNHPERPSCLALKGVKRRRRTAWVVRFDRARFDFAQRAVYGSL